MAAGGDTGFGVVRAAILVVVMLNAEGVGGLYVVPSGTAHSRPTVGLYGEGLAAVCDGSLEGVRAATFLVLFFH